MVFWRCSKLGGWKMDLFHLIWIHQTESTVSYFGMRFAFDFVRVGYVAQRCTNTILVDQSTMNSGKNPSVFFGLTASNKFPSIVSETHEVFDSGQLLWIRNVISRPWHLCVNIHQYSPSFVGRLAKKSLYDIHIQPTQTGLYPIFSASYPQVQWCPKTQGAHMVGGFKHDFK